MTITNLVAILAIIVLLMLAALHLYWALGGRWPGTDDESFIRMTIGRTKNGKPPSALACTLVASCLTAAAGLMALNAGLVRLVLAPDWLVALGYWAAGAVFLARGVAGYVPAITAYARGTPFYRLNQLIYSPLCLLIAASFAIVGV